jgi:hypothetical protein
MSFDKGHTSPMFVATQQASPRYSAPGRLPDQPVPPTHPMAYPTGPSTAPPPTSRPRRRWIHVVGYPAALLVGLGVGAAGADNGAVTATPAGSASAAPAAESTVDATKSTESTKTGAPAEAARKVAPGIGDKVRDGKFRFTVTKVKKGVPSIGGEMLNTEAQGQFVLVHLTVTNIGEEAQTLDGSAQKVFDAKKRKFSADTEAAIYLGDSRSFLEQINPGNTVKGIVVFDIPKAASPVRIELHDSAFSGGVDVALK